MTDHPGIRIDWTRLAKLIKPVLPHMSEDDTLPAIHAIQLSARGDHLYAAATDRYTLAVNRIPANQDVPAFEFLIPADSVKRIVGAFEPLREDRDREPWEDWDDYNPAMYDPPLALEILTNGTNRRLRVATLDGLLGWEAAEQGGGFPKLRALISGALAQAPGLTTPVLLPPTLLARWRAVQDHLPEPLTVWGSGPAKPLVIACGKDFIGLQMPALKDGKPPTLADYQAIVDAWTFADDRDKAEATA